MPSPSLGVKVLYERERGLAFNVISLGGFQPVGTPTTHAAILIAFQNQTDVTVSFSWDGVNSALSLAAGTSFVFDVQTNKKGPADTLMIAKGMTVLRISNICSSTNNRSCIHISILCCY